MDGDAISMRTRQVLAAPGAGFELLFREPADAESPLLLWLPGMGIPARHYLPLAAALTGHGMGVALHEWRGIGSSSMRAVHRENWGYRELLGEDLVASMRACREACPHAPLLLGGHSLGGQLACLFAALHPQVVQGVALVASGAPYWRTFGAAGPFLHAGFTLAPALARLRGYFPGRKLRFAGNEARGVIRDWARSGRSGRYEVNGLDQDIEPALAAFRRPLLALRMDEDRLAPARSVRCLLDKMPGAPREIHVVDRHLLGVRADHFAWMRAPDAVAGRIADWSRRLE